MKFNKQKFILNDFTSLFIHIIIIFEKFSIRKQTPIQAKLKFIGFINESRNFKNRLIIDIYEQKLI